MALTTITNSMVSVNAIQGTLIADNAITAVHIATNAVSSTLIADNAITAVHIAQNVITVTQLADDAVEADKIADGVITTNHLNKAMISSQTEVTAVAGDYVLLGDTSDSNNLKKAATAWLPLAGGTMTGALLAPAGSASAPSYAFSAQASTGMYKPGTSQLYFSVAGTRKMRIESAQIVLEANSSVGGTLDVSSTLTSGDITIDVDDTPSLHFKKQSTADVLASINISTDAGTGGKFVIQTKRNGNTALDRFTIDDDGNVGIGTTSPNRELDVESDSGYDTVVNFRNPSSSWGEYSLARFQTDTKDTRFIELGYYRGTAEASRAFIINGQSSNRLLTINESTGHVGIGDTSPDYLLDVESTTAWGAIIELNQKSEGTEGAQLFLKHESASPADEDYLGFVNFKGMNSADQEVQYARIDAISEDVTDGEEDGRLVFNTAVAGTANTLTMALRAGNVGIGTASPDSKLHIINPDSGTYRFGYNGTSDCYLDADTVYFRNDGATANTMTVTTSGLGIGNTNPSYPLTVQKDVDTYIAKIENDGNSTSSNGLWVDTRWNTATNHTFRVTSNSGTTEQLMVLGDGKVGIGTATPGYPLHVVGAQIGLFNTTPGDAILYLGEGESGGQYGQIKWKSSDDTIRIGTQTGGDTITINESGNVGIGTASPAANLHVYSAGQAIARVEGANQYYSGLMIRNNHSSVQSQWHVAAAGGTSGWGATSGNFIIRDDTTNSTGIEIEKGAGGASGALYIDSSGYVGIGTADPDDALHVAGGFRVNTTTGDGDEARLYMNPGGAADDPQFTLYRHDGVSPSIYLRPGNYNYFENRVEIATTQGAGLTHSKLAIKANADTYTPTGFNEDAAIRLDVDNAENNYVGIGFTHSGQTEGFFGYTRQSATGDIADFVWQAYDGNTNSYKEYFRMASNGDLTGIDTSIASNSDERLKKNIKDFTGGLDLIAKLKPRTFEWKEPQQRKEGTRRGFIAQEVLEVDDYWVDELEAQDKENPEYEYTKDTEKAYTSKLSDKDAMYISAIQELEARIKTLEG